MQNLAKNHRKFCNFKLNFSDNFITENNLKLQNEIDENYYNLIYQMTNI